MFETVQEEFTLKFPLTNIKFMQNILLDKNENYI